MSWMNAELERVFSEIAELLELDDADRFRVRAYERAAAAVTSAREDLGTLEADRLVEVSGIGESTAEKIVEFRESGTIGLLEELRARVPRGVRELVTVPGIGPKLARRLHDELGVTTLDELRTAIDAGDVASLSGLGEKRAARLREAIAWAGAKEHDRTPLADVVGLADAVAGEARELPGVVDAAVAGSVRRVVETVADVDLLISTDAPGEVADALADLGPVAEVRDHGDRKVVLRTRGRRFDIDVRLVPPEAWGAALIYFTGSKAHNVRLRERAVRRGASLNEYGLWEGDRRVAGATEEEVYAALDLPWFPPSLRTGGPEIEAADAGELPQVVDLADVRGDLHGHSDWSGDGRESLEGMVAAAAAQGWDYWAVTDHAADLAINGLDADGFARRRQAIEALRPRAGIAVLDGVELNIDGDGGVDFAAEELARFDWCVASVHTLLDRSADEQTRRVLTAMANPHVHAIGHLTARKIGERPPIALDVDAVVAEAARTQTALEVNGSPARLDLSGELVTKAVAAGVTLTVATDAHAPRGLGNMRTAVATAQGGWARSADVLNCRRLDDVRAFVRAKAERRDA